MFKKFSFSAVILAGGSSVRMGRSKQQIPLDGIPAVVYSMLAFENCRACREIIVVSVENECALYRGYAEKFGITKFRIAVPGGTTRQQSAFIGQKTVDQEIGYIAFHDAARCLIETADIEKVFTAAKRYKCASACCPATDTVKRAGKDMKTLTEGQPDRSELFYMQTPQIFLSDLYRAAAYTARQDGFTGTDDCSLLEHAGFGCKLVECSRLNVKLTTPEDIVFAETVIRERKKRN